MKIAIINLILIFFILSCKNKLDSGKKLIIGKWRYISKDSSFCDDIDFTDSLYYSVSFFSDLGQVQSGRYCILNNSNNLHSNTIFFSPNDLIFENDTFNLIWKAWTIKYLSIDTLCILVMNDDRSNLSHNESVSKKAYNEYIYTRVK